MDTLGSFGSPAGGISPELQAAIQRRAGGNPSGTMGQTTQTAPTFNPAIQRPQVNPTNPTNPANPVSPIPAPTGALGSPPLSQGTGMGLPAESPESVLIIKALDARLRSLSKIQGA